MKVLKVYGEYVYINNEKTSINDVQGTTFFLDNLHNYGYGISNQLVIIENDEELNFFNGSCIEDFEPTRVSYRFYKMLATLPGAGYL